MKYEKSILIASVGAVLTSLVALLSLAFYTPQEMVLSEQGAQLLYQDKNSSDHLRFQRLDWRELFGRVVSYTKQDSDILWTGGVYAVLSIMPEENYAEALKIVESGG